MDTLEIEIEDACYVIPVDTFHPPGRWRSLEQPADPGEICLGDVILRQVDGKTTEVPYNRFIMLYAEYIGVDDFETADRRLHDWAYDELMTALADDFYDP